MWKDQQEDDAPDEGANTSDTVTIEKLVKEFKTHRCALDFDHNFCHAVVIDLTK